MKKLFVFIAALFIGVLTANASITLNNRQCTASETSQNPQNCGLSLTLTGEVIASGRQLNVNFYEPTNIKDGKITITAATGWKVKLIRDEDFGDSVTATLSDLNTYVTFKYVGDAQINEGTDISYATVQYDKEDIGEGCGFKYGFASCNIINDGEPYIYINESGMISTKEEWEKQCTCQVKNIGGKKWYYSKDGNAAVADENTSEDTLAEGIVKECYTCQKVEFDGKTYFMGKTGLVESEEAMNNECFPKCKIVDDKYYDNEGKEITKEEYAKQCKCRIEETKDGKVYYNDKNEVITADEYTNQCQPSVPTGASIPYMLIFGGIALCGVTLVFILRNKSKLKRI